MKIRVLSVSFLFILLGCSIQEPRLIIKTGTAQGSTYQIRYVTTKSSKLDKEIGKNIEKAFKEIDYSMSTWVQKSLINQVNNTNNWIQVDHHFLKVLNRSLEIAKESKGDFDPTIGPLVQIWGFGHNEIHTEVTDEQIQKTLESVGYEKIEIDGQRVRVHKNSMIDFNAIAQGYTVDVISKNLEEHGITRYMVEVGGEVRTRGSNGNNETWVIGVDKPQENIDMENRFQIILKLENASLATSGNYRKFWVDNKSGLKYSHTINPATGYPAKNNLLSASIIAPTAMDADAYATVCMVRGLDDCKELLNSNPKLEGYLIFSDQTEGWQVYITNGFQNLILK